MIVFISYQRADTAFAACAVSVRAPARRARRVRRHRQHRRRRPLSPADLQRRLHVQRDARPDRTVVRTAAAARARERSGLRVAACPLPWHRRGAGARRRRGDAGRRATAASAALVHRRNALALRRGSSIADIDACVAAIPTLAATPRRAARVLWVDDRPANNKPERRQLRPHGIVFDNVVSIDEAVEQLTNEHYDLMITDLWRQGSSDCSSTAGAAFLAHTRRAPGRPAGHRLRRDVGDAPARRPGRAGRLDVTSSRDDLLAMVLDVLGRGPESTGDLQR